MIALMQEDTRKEKERGVENLTIGYFVMKVTIEWRWCELWKYKFKWRYDRRSGICKLNRIKKISRLQRARARIPLNHGLESRRLNCNYHCDDHISTEKLNGEVKIKKLKTKMENWVKNKNEITVWPPFRNSHHLHYVSFLSRVEINSTNWPVPTYGSSYLSLQSTAALTQRPCVRILLKSQFLFVNCNFLNCNYHSDNLILIRR